MLTTIFCKSCKNDFYTCDCSIDEDDMSCEPVFDDEDFDFDLTTTKPVAYSMGAVSLDPIWRCSCEGLAFKTYKARKAHKCPPKNKQLIVATDKVIELARKLLSDYNKLHDDYSKDQTFGFPLEDAINDYLDLKNK